MSSRFSHNQRGRKILKELKSGRTTNLSAIASILFVSKDEELFEEVYPILLHLLRAAPPPPLRVDVMIPLHPVNIIRNIWAGMSILRTRTIVSRLLPQILEGFSSLIPWIELAVLHAKEGSAMLSDTFLSTVTTSKGPPLGLAPGTELFTLTTHLMMGMRKVERIIAPRIYERHDDVNAEDPSKWSRVPQFVYFCTIHWLLNIQMMPEVTPTTTEINELIFVVIQDKYDKGAREQVKLAFSHIYRSNMICLKAISLGLIITPISPHFLCQTLIIMAPLINEYGMEYKTAEEEGIAIRTVCSAFYSCSHNPAPSAKVEFPQALGICSGVLLLLLVEHPSNWVLALSHRRFLASFEKAIVYANSAPEMSVYVEEFFKLLSLFQTAIQMERIIKHVPNSFRNNLQNIKLTISPPQSPLASSPIRSAEREEREEIKRKVKTFVFALDFYRSIYEHYSSLNRNICDNRNCKTGPAPKKTFKLCGRCQASFYCSRDCQKRDWKVGHRLICRRPGYRGAFENNRDKDFFRYTTELVGDPITMRRLFGDRGQEYSEMAINVWRNAEV